MQQLSHSASVAECQDVPGQCRVRRVARRSLDALWPQWCGKEPPCFVALLGCGTEAGGHPGTSWDAGRFPCGVTM